MHRSRGTPADYMRAPTLIHFGVNTNLDRGHWSLTALSLVGDSHGLLCQTGGRVHLATVTVGDTISATDWIPHHGAGNVALCNIE